MSEKSIVITFRVKPRQLAKALDGIMRYNRNFWPDKLSIIAKEAFDHGVNYLTEQMPLEPSEESQMILQSLSKQIRFDQANPLNQPGLPPKPMGGIDNEIKPKGAFLTESPRAKLMRINTERFFDEQGYKKPEQIIEPVTQPIKQSGSLLGKDIETDSEKSSMTPEGMDDFFKDMIKDKDENDD